MKLGGREIVFALLWPLKRRGICSVSFFDWGVGKKKRKRKKKRKERKKKRGYLYGLSENNV